MMFLPFGFSILEDISEVQNPKNIVFPLKRRLAEFPFYLGKQNHKVSAVIRGHSRRHRPALSTFKDPQHIY